SSQRTWQRKPRSGSGEDFTSGQCSLHISKDGERTGAETEELSQRQLVVYDEADGLYSDFCSQRTTSAGIKPSALDRHTTASSNNITARLGGKRLSGWAKLGHKPGFKSLELPMSRFQSGFQHCIMPQEFIVDFAFKLLF
ncbi:unnamed protein product, partial [Protopolystoma xenopodis]